MESSSKPAIKVVNLFKTFLMRETQPGFLGTLKSLIKPKIREMHAIQQLSFEVQPGEKIAFIGPNGAGKSTTIKMLTGILYPTSGQIEVLGLVPWKQRQELGFKIGTVFGQRTQLWYHLPALDTFALLAKIYELDDAAYQKRLKELIEIFEIGPLLNKPVRQMSLGERMRCEVVASLLHKPDILFLDEPTIGLDVNAKLMIRGLLNRLTHEHGTTLFLTSHDTADLEQVCERVLILDKGSLIMNSSIRELKKTFIKKKVLTLITDAESIPLNLPGIKILKSTPYHTICEIDLSLTPIEQVIHEALKTTSLKDVTIEDPSMEDIIRGVYAKASA
jgi:ABC-2 type transport system ATP-binding protein